MARIFLAGSENTTHLEALMDNGASNVLFSYFYIAKRGQINQLFHLLDQYPQVKLFLDSGAFSFRVGTTKLNGKAQQSPHDYFKGYLNFLKRYGHRFEFAAEFDVDGYDESCTDEQLEIWRSQMCTLNVVKVVPVWHVERGKEAWESYCNDPRYQHLGLGSGADVPLSLQSRLVNRAHLFGKTVHGFAQTKILTAMRFVKYDTVDSTSWKSGERFGQTYIFWKNRWVVLSKQDKEKRIFYKTYYKAIGCKWQKILRDDIEEVRKANIIAWENLSRRLQLIHKSHVGLSTHIKNRDESVQYQTGDGYVSRALDRPRDDDTSILVVKELPEPHETVSEEDGHIPSFTYSKFDGFAKVDVPDREA